MRELFKGESTDPIDDLINEVLEEMKRSGAHSDNYSTLMTYAERLYDIKTNQRPNSVSRDTIAIIAGNLLGILLIVAYEQKHVMTSKGFSQIIRPKQP